MKRFRRVVLVALAAVVVVVAGFAAHSHLASPAAVARDESYRVWTALLKGLEGDVYYVGNDSDSAYFRVGRVFWSYFKVPGCAARVPQVFPVGSGEPYVVRLHVQSDNSISVGKACSDKQGYELGQLDRA